MYKVGGFTLRIGELDGLDGLDVGGEGDRERGPNVKRVEGRRGLPSRVYSTISGSNYEAVP